MQAIFLLYNLHVYVHPTVKCLTQRGIFKLTGHRSLRLKYILTEVHNTYITSETVTRKIFSRGTRYP